MESTHRRNSSVRAAPVLAQSCLILCDPMDCSPPGSSVHGISQQEYWSGLPLPPLGILLAAAAAKSLQSCPTLCDLIDGSPPDSPVPGILQARTLEWVAIFSSRESFLVRDQIQVWSLLHWQLNSLSLSHLGSLIKR